MATDSSDPTDTPERSPIVQEIIDETMAPYRGILPEEMFSYFEAMLDCQLSTDPRIVPLLRRLRQWPRLVSSGIVDRSGAPVLEEETPPEAASKGKE
jgi:hypothetical protein